MQTRALTVTNPKEQAEAKSRLLRAAISLIIERKPTADMSTVLIAFLEHVARKLGLDLTQPRDRLKAEGIITCTLNLGLDRHSGGEVDKAAKALFKNPRAVFQLGEKTIADLEARVKKDWKANLITVSSPKDSRRVYYGIAGTRTEQALYNWHKNGISDHPTLPPATMAELDPISGSLEQLEIEISLAKKINWQTILADSQGVCKFAAGYFIRPKKYEPSLAGGVWPAFLNSLLVKALSTTYGLRVIRHGHDRPDMLPMEQALLEKYLVIDEKTLREFLEMIMFEPEKIIEQAPVAAARINSVAFQEHRGVFSGHCSNEDVGSIIGFAEYELSDFVQTARSFYMQVTSVDQPSLQELDRFWRSRLLLHNTAAVDLLKDRLIEEEALRLRPWERVDECRNLEEVASCLAGFAVWPEESRDEFVKTFDFNRWLDTEDRHFVAQRLMNIWRALAKDVTNGRGYIRMIVRMRINWTKRSSLIHDLISMAKDGEFNEELEIAAGATSWTTEQIIDLYRGSFDGIGLESAVRSVQNKMTDRHWREIIPAGSACSDSVFRAIFLGMSEEQRINYLTRFYPARLASALEILPQRQFNELFAPILAKAKADPKYQKDFFFWLIGKSRDPYSSFSFSDKQRDQAFRQMIADL